MFYQIFLSPKVKRCAIIIYKHGICELPHEFPSDLRLLGILGRCPNFIESWPSAQSSFQYQNFVNTIKNVAKNSF